jgi:hypothetical protein
MLAASRTPPLESNFPPQKLQASIHPGWQIVHLLLLLRSCVLTENSQRIGVTTPPQTTKPKESEPPPPGTALGIAAVVLSYFIPGMGHLCIGHKARGLLFLITIHGLFALGMLLSGIRAISPQEQPIWSITQYLAGWPTLVMAPFAKKVEAGLPAANDDYLAAYAKKYAGLKYSRDPFGRDNLQISRDGDLRVEEDTLREEKINERGEKIKPYTPAERAAAKERRQKFAAEYNAAHGIVTYSPKMFDVGAVYCGIAGMLNLLVMFDVILRVTGSERHPPDTEESAEKSGEKNAAGAA